MNKEKLYLSENLAMKTTLTTEELSIQTHSSCLTSARLHLPTNAQL